MYSNVLLAALVPLALGEYSYSFNAPTAVPTSETRAPTRTETYAPTRMTEAPSYAPTTDTYAPSYSGCPPLGYLPPGDCPDDTTGLRMCAGTGLAPDELCVSSTATCSNTPSTGCAAVFGAGRRLRGSDTDDPVEACLDGGCVVAKVLDHDGADPFVPTRAPTGVPSTASGGFFGGPLEDPFNDALKAKGYMCDATAAKVEREITDDALPPLGGRYPFGAGWAFANDTATWVRGVLGLTAAEMPLHFAFYVNGNRSFDHECDTMQLKGADSCQYLRAQAGRPAFMGNYVLALLDKKDATPWLRDPAFNSSVLKLAYDAFVAFITPTCGAAGVQNSGCDKVYVPGSQSDCGPFCGSNTCANYVDGGDEGLCPTYASSSCFLEPEQCATDYDSAGFVCCCNERTDEAQACGAESPPIPTLAEFAANETYRPFWGSSSGGGSGGSLAVKCLTKDNFPIETILVSGGGGGGGGYTSPQGVADRIVGIAAGGGGGGGAQVGSLSCVNATALVGAGAGNHPPGLVDLNGASSTPADWVAAMAMVRENMTACYESNETDLVLSGEGGSGFGLQHLVGFNASEVQQNQTLSIGFRFQFAMGQGNGSLIRDTQPPVDASGVGFTGGKAYVVCEHNAPGDCRNCVNPSLYPNDGDNNSTRSNAFECAGKISPLICDHWMTNFTKADMYLCCMSSVETIYKDAWPGPYAPTPPPSPQQPFCGNENETKHYQKCLDPDADFTEAMIIANPGWCPTAAELVERYAQACPPFPGCH